MGMMRHALLAGAALGAMGVYGAMAAAADVVVGDSNARTGELANGSSDYGLGVGDFDDVTAVDIDVTRMAGALGLVVDRRNQDLLGRVALRVVDDPRVGEPPDLTDADDPYVRLLEQRTPAPVRTRDVRGEPRGVQPQRGLRLDYARPVSGGLPGDLELALEPRANAIFSDQVSGVGGGALVRFGRNLTAPRDEQSGWYAFIGADAQALTWSLGDRRQQEHALRLEDKQMVGDYQAGVALRIAHGDLAFGFVHREVSWNDVSREEQFVGVSFTRKR
jgi:hypothetical protein